ncbi:MAG: hypothetical protein AAF658_11310, partial [Myxococcota bacterium]
VVDRFGPMTCLIGLGLLNIAVSLSYALIGLTALGPNGALCLILYANASVFASFTASRAAIMPLCAPGRQATEFANLLAEFVGADVRWPD